MILFFFLFYDIKLTPHILTLNLRFCLAKFNQKIRGFWPYQVCCFSHFDEKISTFFKTGYGGYVWA